MNRKAVFEYCNSLARVTEEYPFGDGVAVFKVVGKMFALVPVDGAVTMTLKCDPELAVWLRQKYAAVEPGYHTNKQHWNTVAVDGSIADDELREMIEHSYDQVVAGLPKSKRPPG
ncbi:MAG TPA: MmcQ/YjbR family DNA-binding protein [Acidimicrobiales bacterium]|nr:MmcQ/YjbR family DNA-binding protein [Acidimicrobiales bacterium]